MFTKIVEYSLCNAGEHRETAPDEWPDRRYVHGFQWSNNPTAIDITNINSFINNMANPIKHTFSGASCLEPRFTKKHCQTYTGIWYDLLRQYYRHIDDYYWPSHVLLPIWRFGCVGFVSGCGGISFWNFPGRDAGWMNPGNEFSLM